MPILLQEDMERPLPKLYRVRQQFDDSRLEDVAGAVAAQCRRPEIAALVKPGARVAVAGGSRGIRNLDVIVREVVAALKELLLPLATVLTPNIPEAEVLSGLTISGPEDMERAAREIGERYGCAVLCKGGHDLNDANDLLWQDGSCKWFCGRRIHNPNTHGTGCTLSSAIASNLAKGCDLETAVERAKIYLSGALSSMLDLGAGSGPLDHLFSIPELDLDRIRSLQSPAGGR